MAQRQRTPNPAVDAVEPRAIRVDDDEGWPVYQDGVIIDRIYPSRYPPVDPATLPKATREALALFGSIQVDDWNAADADLERIDREDAPSPPADESRW